MKRSATACATLARVLCSVLLLLSLVLTGTSGVARADAPSVAASADVGASHEVRTGTTSVESPAPTSANEPPNDAVERARPGDSPRIGGTLPRIADPPEIFNVYEGGWIRFAYPPGQRERVQPLFAQADDVRAELSAWLGQPVLKKVTVYIARTPGEMATLAPEGVPFPKYAAGVAYSQLGLVLLTIQPVYANAQHDLGEIFRHELSHVALENAVGSRMVPRWFNEGFAVFSSGESSLQRMQTLSTATVAGTLVPLRHLERTFPADPIEAELAYAEAADVVRFLLRQQDRHRFTSMIERIKKGQTFEAALHDAYSVDLVMFEQEWREDVAKRYTFWPVLFSGTLVWAGVMGLFVWGWRRKRKQNQETLERWAREEAQQDELRRRLAAAEQNARVHIVLARRSAPQLRNPAEVEVPKVEHDGQWHTLH